MLEFIQDQILGMKWLSSLIGRLLTAVGLDVNTRIGGSVQFFLYDVIKITVLLCVLIFVISYIQSFFPPERSRKIMGRFHGIYKRWTSAGRDIFVPDLVSDGGSGQPRSADEHFWC